MRAELLIEMHMRAFAEEMKIEVGEYGRKTVGIFQLKLAFPVAHAHAIASGPICKRAFEQSRIVDSVKLALAALLIDHGNAFRVRQKHAHNRHVVLHMRPEIVEWVGMATLDHRIGFGG